MSQLTESLVHCLAQQIPRHVIYTDTQDNLHTLI